MSNLNFTLLGQLITFFIFLGVIYKYVVPALLDAIETRENTIIQGLANAEKARIDLENAEEKSRELELAAKEKSHSILLSAEQKSAALISQAKEDAKLAGKKELELSKEEILQAQNKAKETLRKEFAEMVLLTAAQVIGREVDPKKHAELIDDAIRKLG